MGSRIEAVRLPEFGRDDAMPGLAVEEYEQRLEAAVSRMKSSSLDFLLVYADREHFANIAFLTGFDPRFEEALLLLDGSGRRRLIVGNECMGYLPDERLRCEAVLHQEFSLLGQPRGNSTALSHVLAEFGIGPRSRVGCVGWKYFDDARVPDAAHALDIPSYLADTVRELAGGRNFVSNATALFMNCADGLRTVNSAAQLAQFEFAAGATSDAVLAVVRAIELGKPERDLERLLDGRGLPRSCHAMINFGAKARRGLSSPADSRARRGDAYTVAFGVWGALTCRAGVLCSGPDELPPELREFYPAFAANYFDVVATWYESCRVGATGGSVFAAVELRRNPKLYNFCVNPGHLIHQDEWVNSPFARGDETPLRSGMALQMDIIPISNGPFCCANAEDGIALADAKLRDELARGYPSCWKRILARREFMTGALGIRLDESVLPLGNTSGWLAPYALAPQRALVKA